MRAFLAFFLFVSAGYADPLWRDPLVAMPNAPFCEVSRTLPNPLLLGDSLRIALCQNPTMRGAWAGVRTSGASLGSARSAYLPTLTGNGSLTRSRTGSTGAHTEASSASGSLNLSYLLWDFGGRRGALDSAKAVLEASFASEDETQQALLAQVVRVYMGVFGAEATLAAARSSEASYTEAWKAASLRLKIGAATPVDALTAQSSMTQAKMARQKAERALEQARGGLASAMGISPDVSFTLPAKPPALLPKAEFAPVQKLLAKAEARPDVRAALASAKQAAAAVDVAASAGRPTLSLVGSASTNKELTADSTRTAGSSVGINLSFPLFSGFDTTYKVRAAREAFAKAQASKDSVLNAALLDIWTTHSAYFSALDTRATAGALLESSTAAEKLALGRYKAGVSTMTELLNAEATLASAREQKASADVAALVALADLLRALGVMSSERFLVATKGDI